MKRVASRHKHNHSSTKQDRLSDLSDCILLHILSFLDFKLAVQTLILSKRWKNIWKHLTNLTLMRSVHFRNSNTFNTFVSHFLSLRDSSTSLHVLHCDQFHNVNPHLLNRMVNYAVSHNVQQIHICVICDSRSLPPNVQYFLPTLFSCQTLTSLNLCVSSLEINAKRTIFPNSPNLPELISLSLESFFFLADDDGCAEPFSALRKLKTLIIDECEVLSSRDNLKLCISSSTLVNLTIVMPEPEDYDDEPDLGIELCTPSLCTFDFIGIPIQKLCGSKSNLSTINHVNIHVDWTSCTTDTPSVLLQWLVELANIKSLTVTLSTLKVLYLVPDLLKVELPSLRNLKSLTVKIDTCSSIPEGIVDFLIQNSRSAKVDIIRLIKVRRAFNFLNEI